MEIVIQSLVVAGVTAVATGFVTSKVTAAHLKDLTDRVVRIENYLNGLLGHRK